MLFRSGLCLAVLADRPIEEKPEKNQDNPPNPAMTPMNGRSGRILIRLSRRRRLRRRLLVHCLSLFRTSVALEGSAFKAYFEAKTLQ